MTWNIATRSKMVTTRLGKVAVRVDGGADMAPLLLCQRFRGTMEDWDPEFISRLAVGRQVIRFDSAGIGESEGETPNAIEAMAEIVPALLDALKLDRTDLFGWSLGGYVAQIVALNWPRHVRQLVIAGSGPGGPDGPLPHPRVAEIAVKQVPTQEDLHFLFFTDSKAGVAAAQHHLTNIRVDEHAPVLAESGHRQREAIVAWWRGSGRHARDLPNFRYQCSSPMVSRMSWSRLSIALRLLEQHQTRSWFSTQTPGTRSYSSTPKSSVKKYWHS